MMKIFAPAFLTIWLSGQLKADTYIYHCILPGGDTMSVKINDTNNTLQWRGSKTYALKDQPSCAKAGWRAIAKGESFNFCTATQGSGGIEMDNGTVIQCQLAE